MEDFNLDLAKEYFEKSKMEKSRSKYGKESNQFLNQITRFERLQSLYKEVVKNPDEEMEYDDAVFDYQDDSDIIDTSPQSLRSVAIVILRAISFSDKLFFLPSRANNSLKCTIKYRPCL